MERSRMYRRIGMKTNKKITVNIHGFIFICATILFLLQVWGMIDYGNAVGNVTNGLHKVILGIFFILVWLYKEVTPEHDTKGLLAHGVLTVSCIALCLFMRKEFRFNALYENAIIYLLALPIPELLGDTRKQLYLKWFACLYSGVSFINLLGSYALIWGVGLETLPTRFHYHETRLSVGPHPNITAILFSISIGMLVYLCYQAKSKVWKWVLGILACAYFPLLWLTNSRTNALFMTAFVVGVVFYSYLSRNKKIDIKKVGALLLALCGFAMLLLLVHSILFASHRDALLETINTEVDLQMSFWDSLATFNGRTDIWKFAFEIIFDSRENFLYGTGNPIHFTHSHNAWVECFLRLGVLGFAFSIYYAIRAMKAVFTILISKRRKSTMAQKTMALLLLVLLVVNTMEPYAFVNIVILANFVFFLLLGYVMAWEKELKRNLKEKRINEKI